MSYLVYRTQKHECRIRHVKIVAFVLQSQNGTALHHGRVVAVRREQPKGSKDKTDGPAVLGRQGVFSKGHVPKGDLEPVVGIGQNHEQRQDKKDKMDGVALLQWESRCVVGPEGGCPETHGSLPGLKEHKKGNILG